MSLDQYYRVLISSLHIIIPRFQFDFKGRSFLKGFSIVFIINYSGDFSIFFQKKFLFYCDPTVISFNKSQNYKSNHIFIRL